MVLGKVQVMVVILTQMQVMVLILEQVQVSPKNTEKKSPPKGEFFRDFVASVLPPKVESKIVELVEETLQY